MKTRVTFRVSAELADSLRDLPNQTQFVESALREALRERGPACQGTGRRNSAGLCVSNFRSERLPQLERAAALQLRNLVHLARHAAATRIDLTTDRRGALDFEIARGAEVLL